MSFANTGVAGAVVSDYLYVSCFEFLDMISLIWKSSRDECNGLAFPDGVVKTPESYRGNTIRQGVTGVNRRQVNFLRSRQSLRTQEWEE